MEELFKSCVTKETTSKNNHSKHDSPTHNEGNLTFHNLEGINKKKRILTLIPFAHPC